MSASSAPCARASTSCSPAAGSAGIGKTRLAVEAAEEARSRGATVLWGACVEGEGAPAFWPWRQV